MKNCASWLWTLAFVFVAHTASAADRLLGPVTVTAGQTIWFHFVNLQPTPEAPPLNVALSVVYNGQVVGGGGVNCEGPFCQFGAITVEPGKVTSVQLEAASLNLTGSQSATIQPVVSIAGGSFPHLLTVVDAISVVSPVRTALQYALLAYSQVYSQWRNVALGPLVLQPQERAKLTVTSRRTTADATLSFMDANGAALGGSTFFKLNYLQTASIEFDGALYSGPIRGEVITNLSVVSTLEIIDKITNTVKVSITDDGSGYAGGSGKGAGGGDL